MKHFKYAGILILSFLLIAPSIYASYYKECLWLAKIESIDIKEKSTPSDKLLTRVKILKLLKAGGHNPGHCTLERLVGKSITIKMRLEHSHYRKFLVASRKIHLQYSYTSNFIRNKAVSYESWKYIPHNLSYKEATGVEGPAKDLVSYEEMKQKFEQAEKRLSQKTTKIVIRPGKKKSLNLLNAANACKEEDGLIYSYTSKELSFSVSFDQNLLQAKTDKEKIDNFSMILPSYIPKVLQAKGWAIQSSSGSLGIFKNNYNLKNISYKKGSLIGEFNYVTQWFSATKTKDPYCQNPEGTTQPKECSTSKNITHTVNVRFELPMKIPKCK